MKMSERVQNALLLCGSLVFAILLSEAVLRVVNYRPRVADPEMYVRHDSEIQPYKLRANYEGYYLGRRVEIDSNGHRVVRPGVVSPDDANQSKKTVLLIGDSVVFGHGLGNKETIASQMQRFFNRKDIGYNVDNIGVPGYTSWNEYGAMKEYFEREKPDVVVVIYVSNDISRDNDQLGIGAGEFSHIEDNLFHEATQIAYRYVYTTYLLREGIQMMKAMIVGKRGKREGGRIKNDSLVTYSMRALDGMKRYCEKNDVVFAVGVLRGVSYFYDPSGVREYEKTVLNALDRNGINSFLVKAHIDSLSMNQARVYWNDSHPSARAVKYIKDEIYKEIDEYLNSNESYGEDISDSVADVSSAVRELHSF